MRKDVRCSRCGFVVHGDDPLYENRKQRHEDGRHTRHKINKNLDFGKVEWMPIWT